MPYLENFSKGNLLKPLLKEKIPPLQSCPGKSI